MSTSRSLSLAVLAAGLCVNSALADFVYVYIAGPNSLDTIDDGSFIQVGTTEDFNPAPGVVATNSSNSKTWEQLFAWSDSIVYINGATFFGTDLQAHDSSTINYQNGNNGLLGLVAFDDGTVNFSGGTISAVGTGGGMGAGGHASVSGGHINDAVVCVAGSISVSGGEFGAPTYGLPFSFISMVPAGVAFSGTDIEATFIGIDMGNGFDGNVWQLTGTLANGDSVDGLFMVDVGIFDPTVIVNYSGVAIAGDDPDPVDTAPVANAGLDFSVNEGDLVILDGSLSSDADGDTLTYSWVQLPGGPTVTLNGADTANPTFTSPTVAFGGQTLSFQLTVTANGVPSTDSVSVNVVNINHAPVANAGVPQTVVEGAMVTLHGEDSFDIDGDTISYAWTQVGGTPTVMLTGAGTANPQFVAPWVGSGGAALTFQLKVADGFPADAPAGGYSLSNVVATVTITITNVNGIPTAKAGPDQCIKEGKPVSLNGTASSDPDGDTLTYSWTQVSGPAVTLTGANTATPSFTAPMVNTCGASVTFKLTVNDGFGGTAWDTVTVVVKNAVQPPDVTNAHPSEGCLWPPNHKLECIEIEGVSGAGDVDIDITAITQDEPTNGLGDGDTAIDGIIKANGRCYLRAERKGNGNGRVYTIHFKATNAGGTTTGSVKVIVPHSKNSGAVDSGQYYDSTH